MTYRTPKKLSATNGLSRTFLKSIILAIGALAALATVSHAAELPAAPSSVIRLYAAVTAGPVSVSAPRIAEPRTIDKKFLDMAFISSPRTFADSYTTLFARENWFA